MVPAIETKRIQDTLKMSTPAGEDAEDFFSVCSHFCDREAHTTKDDLLFGSDSESARILSDTENQRLNRKIDLLLETLESGRRVNFHPNSVTGEVDVTAEYLDHVSVIGYDRVEADIAAYPQNFGNIIHNRRHLLRSLNSILFSRFSTNSSSDPLEESQRGKILHTPDVRLGHKQTPTFGSIGGSPASPESQNKVNCGAPKQRNAEIHRALRYLEKEAGEPKGSLLPIMSSLDVQIHYVLPFPINYAGSPEFSTSIVHSGVAELDRSSPLFMLSRGRRNQDHSDWISDRSSNRERAKQEASDRVFQWLYEVEEPLPLMDIRDEKAKARAFTVLRDSHHGDTRSIAGQPDHQSRVLKDVSNLRRPGYLQHNSFAVANSSKPNPRDSEAKPAGFGGAADKNERLAYIEAKWPGVLPGTLDSNSAGKLKVILEKISKVELIPSEASYPQRGESPIAKPTSQESLQAARFEKALARLEGRTPPSPSSPVQRYVYLDGVYGSDVEVDIRPVQCGQPSAIRYAPRRGTRKASLAEQFEKMVVKDDGERNNNHGT